MSLSGTFHRELAAAGLPHPPAARAVAPGEVASLPAAAQRYLRFMRVLEVPRIESFRVGSRGRFRLQPDGRWMGANAWKYSARDPIARLFYMTLRMGRVLPVLGRDTYLEGRGRMRVRPLDLFTVEDAQGPEYDLGELVTWLNDGALLAPSMLLGGPVAWNEGDAQSFELAVTDHGRTARARVRIDGRGAPVDFETTDRFLRVGKAPPWPGAGARSGTATRESSATPSWSSSARRSRSTWRLERLLHRRQQLLRKAGLLQRFGGARRHRDALVVDPEAGREGQHRQRGVALVGAQL